MLDGIDDVDWASRHHAYGPAVDVPDDIRALGSDDAQVRSDAFSRLYGSVWHQGTRWRASQLIVAFLVELASDPETGDRVRILHLLVNLAVRDPTDWLEAGFDESGLVSGDETFEAGDNEYQVDELDVYEAVCAEGKRLRSLASDQDPEVRQIVALTLAMLPRIGDDSLPVMAVLAESEANTRLQATALISVAILAQSMGRESPVDLAAFLESHDATVRYAAAVGLVRLSTGDVSTAVAHLAEATVARPALTLYSNDGDLARLAALTLEVAPEPITAQAIRVLSDQLEDAEGPAAEMRIRAILQILFRYGRSWVPSEADGLSNAQRLGLDVLAESESVWNLAAATNDDVSQLLSHYGLPSTQHDMRAYLSS